MQIFPKSFQRLVLSCVVAVAVIAGVAFLVWPREPRYNGHTLSYWLDRLPPANVPGTAYSHWSAHEAAIEAIQALGPACLPTLQARISETHAVATALNWTLSRNTMSRPLSAIAEFRGNLAMAPQQRRWQAATALIMLGNTAKPLVPELIDFSRSHLDPSVRGPALVVLQRLSPSDYATVMARTNLVSQATH